MDVTNRIQEQLKGLETRRLEGPTSRQAAVLMAVVVRDGQPHFLLTRRTQSVATHKGQISFPGGVREAEDTTLVDTALRETHEEIGVESRQVSVLGEFHDYLAVTDHLVRSVVGLVSAEATFQPQQDEVEYLLEIPFEFFRNTDPSVEKRFCSGRTQNVYFYDFNGETVWGLTARMIKEFLDFLG